MIKTRTILLGLALVVGLAAMAAALWSVQGQQNQAQAWGPEVSATVNNDWSVDLTLESNPNLGWYFTINNGACTASNYDTYSGIRGYNSGTHTVRAYTDNVCLYQQVDSTTFTIPTASLSATVNDDWAVDLGMSDGPSPWWFKIDNGGCTQATGTAYNGIRGYTTGTHGVKAYLDGSCATQVATASFTVPTASLSATANYDQSVDLALSDGPSPWWFRISNGGCTQATGTAYNGIQGYAVGTYNVKAYANSGCSTQIAADSFTVAPLPSLSATVDGSWQATASLSNGPSPWYLTQNDGTCLSVTGASHSYRVYQSGTYSVKAWADSSCATQIATTTTFTIADASLTATVGSDQKVDLALSNGPSSWWYKVGASGSCTSATGTTVNDLSGYDAGTYTVTAFSGSECRPTGQSIASATFTIVDPSLTATVDNNWQVTVTLSYGPNQWWRTDNGAGCSPVTGTSFTYQEHESGTQSVEAWSDSSCSTQIATTSYTLADASLTATVDSDKSVDLALSNGPNSWWYKAGASGSCTSATGTTVDDLSGYDAGTHTVTAYMDNNCRHDIASTTFTIVDPSLTATVGSDSKVDLALSDGPSSWWFKVGTSGSCTSVTGTTVNDLSGYGSGIYNVQAYSNSDCSTQIAAASFVIPYTMTASVSDGDLYLRLHWTNGSSWWYQVDSGDCTKALDRTTGPITGLTAGSHTATAHNDSGCATQIASATFAVPSMSATVNTDATVDLTLSDWSGSWWYKVGSSGSCTSASGNTVSGLSGYAAGTHTATAYSGSKCTDRITSATFTMPSLTATVGSDQKVDLALSDWSHSWWFKVGTSGSCTSVTGTTVNDLSGYGSGIYNVQAYSNSDCSTQIASASFVIPYTMTAGLSDGNLYLRLSWTNGGSWWHQVDGSDCTKALDRNTGPITGLSSGSHTATAYNDSGCATEIASTTFTIP